MDVNLILLKNGIQHRVLTLPAPNAVLGREHGCNLRIPVISVSRKHCQISLKNDALTIRDLGSRNGTRLNGKTVKEAKLKAGDCIKIGPVQFLCQINGVPPKDKQQPSPKEDLSEKTAPATVATDDLLADKTDTQSDALEDLSPEDLEKFLDNTDSQV